MRDIAHLIKREISKAQHSQCAYCGKTKSDLTLEHIHPVCYGGKYDWINLVATCYRCNHRKGNMFVDKFIDKHPHFTTNFVEVVNESPVTIARSLIIFYMANPIISHLPQIKDYYSLSNDEYLVLGYGVLNYFSSYGKSIGIEESEVRKIITVVKGKIGCSSLRDIYINLWEYIKDYEISVNPRV